MEISKYIQYYRQLTPLDDLIDQYAPNVQALFQERPDYPPALRGTDGQIYGLPIGDESTHNIIDSQMWINTAWLEKTGLPMPETTDEFKKVLEAFRDGDMNGNGDTTDEIPLPLRQHGDGVLPLKMYLASSEHRKAIFMYSWILQTIKQLCFLRSRMATMNA